MIFNFISPFSSSIQFSGKRALLFTGLVAVEANIDLKFCSSIVHFSRSKHEFNSSLFIPESFNLFLIFSANMFKVKTRKYIKDRMDFINSEYKKDKEFYDGLFIKIMNEFEIIKGADVSRLTQMNYPTILAWTVSDWYDFIPYISKPVNDLYLSFYKNFLKGLMKNNVLLFEHDMKFERFVLKLWTESKHLSCSHKKKLNLPFHISYLIEDSDLGEFTCPACNNFLTCNLNGMCYGECGKGKLKTFSQASVSLCSNHQRLLFELSDNKFGLQEIYVLNDGRSCVNLSYLKLVASNSNVVCYCRKPVYSTYVKEEETDDNSNDLSL